MSLLVVVRMLFLAFHLYVQVALLVEVNVEVFLRHSRRCNLHFVVVRTLLDVYCRCRCAGAGHEVGVKEIIEYVG